MEKKRSFYILEELLAVDRRAPAPPPSSKGPSKSPAKSTISETTAAPASSQVGYLRRHVFYTESTIFLAPGCDENTSSTSGDRMAGTIGPWDRYQAVDSQQSYIRAQLYIHGVTLSIPPPANYHGYPIWYYKVMIQTIVTPSLHYRWRAEPEDQKFSNGGQRLGFT